MANQNNPRYDANGYNSRGRRQIKGYSQKQNGFSQLNQAQQGSNDLYSSGMKIGKEGNLVPLRNYSGTVASLSQQRNSLSPSGGSRPMNDMYLDDPTFFNRRPGGSQGFGEMLGQTREQRVAQAQQEGTFGTIRDKFNLDNAAKGSSMNEFGNIISKLNNQPAPSAGQGGQTDTTGNRPVDSMLLEKRGFPGGATSPTFGSQPLPDDTPGAASSAARGMAFKGASTGAPTGASTLPTPSTPSQTDMNRQALEQAAAGIKLRREASGELPTITNSDGIKRVEGKYGHGASTRVPSAGGEGMIGKQKFSEVMQGLANKPGVASPGDRFQPQQWNNLKRTKK